MLSVILTHTGVLGVDGESITTALTPVDLHDIARSCRTYDADPFYVVHPSAHMQELMQSIIRHWTTGSGARKNPDRAAALNLIHPVAALDEAIEDQRRRYEMEPVLVATSAKDIPGAEGIEEIKKKFYKRRPLCILLGSGWGLCPELVARCHTVAKPIRSCAAYNHLSVRAAAAILLDRFLGDGEE